MGLITKTVLGINKTNDKAANENKIHENAMGKYTDLIYARKEVQYTLL